MAETYLDTWAVVELFGHQKEVGHVVTEYFGTACFLRVDVPDIPEREYELKSQEWIEDGSGGTYAPVGTKVKREAIQGRSRLLGPGSIYAINPCSEAVAMATLERLVPKKLKIVELAKAKRSMAFFNDRWIELHGADSKLRRPHFASGVNSKRGDTDSMTWSLTASGNREAIGEIIDKNLTSEEAKPKEAIKQLILDQIPAGEEDITVIAGGSTYLAPNGKSGSIGVNASFKVAEKAAVTEESAKTEPAKAAAHAETETDAA